MTKLGSHKIERARARPRPPSGQPPLGGLEHLDQPRPVKDLEGSALSIIDEALEGRRVVGLYALFSGGHDSLTSTHLASRHPAFKGVVHINTGIGVPETNEFARDTAASLGWPLYELRHGGGQITYLQLVIRHGFPGGQQHPVMYRYLKERQLDQFCVQLGKERGQVIALAGGARRQESRVRMGTVRPYSINRNRLWVQPIHDWTATECSAYMRHYGLERNPVKDRLHISGECLCGCWADTHEREEIAMWYPSVHHELRKLESLVRAASRMRVSGVSVPQQRQEWGWGRHGPAPSLTNTEAMPMCRFCHAGRSGMIALPGLHTHEEPVTEQGIP